MKETMIERVAKEIEPNAFRQFWSLRDHCLRSGDTPEEALSIAQWAHGSDIDAAMAMARAAIEAMREPTKAMVDPGYEAVHSCIDYYCYDSGSGYTIEPFAPTEIWQAMIDAALHEKEGSE